MSRTAWDADAPDEELARTLVNSERVKARKRVRDADRLLQGAVEAHNRETAAALARMVELDGPITTDPIGWMVTGWRWASYPPSIHADRDCGYLNSSTIEPVLARDALAQRSQGCNSCGRAFWMLRKIVEREAAEAREAVASKTKTKGRVKAKATPGQDNLFDLASGN